MVSVRLLPLILLFIIHLSWSLIHPHSLFGDNMVLQQNQETFIFGTAAPFENVTLRGTPSPYSEYKSVADADGKWMIRMNPYRLLQQEKHIGTINSYTLELEGSKDSIIYTAKNVSYGEVLLCSGQSNMALNMHPIYDNETIIKTANHPDLRLFRINATARKTPAFNVSAIWQQTTPLTIPQFSAVCYLTALKLQQLHGDTSKRVFGLIEAAVGSTDVQSWMSQEAREKARVGCWSLSGQPPPDHLPPSNSHAPAGGENATFLWNGMISPLIPFAIRAVLWDQGENNAHYCSTRQYNCLFSSMISSWRHEWKRIPKTLPVAFVQIGGYNSEGNVSTIRFAQSDSLPANSGWFTNHSQSRIPTANTVMIPTYDLGSPCPTCPNGTWWIHCRNKTEVSRRLALQLNHLLMTNVSTNHKQSSSEYSGPIVLKTAVDNFSEKKPRVLLTMTHADGLVLAPAQGCVQCCEQKGYLFKVANQKGIWFPAIGDVLKTNPTATVVVVPLSNVTISSIIAVQFAVQDVPQCALYNSAQLPAVPFSLPVPWKNKMKSSSFHQQNNKS